jgi:hypothetical protein
MPPAFNLSQDQTLQFKSQNSRSTRHQSKRPLSETPRSTTFTSVRASILLLASRSRRTPQIKNPHLSVVSFLKSWLRGTGFETCDLRVMSPTSCQTAPPPRLSVSAKNARCFLSRRPEIDRLFLKIRTAPAAKRKHSSSALLLRQHVLTSNSAIGYGTSRATADRQPPKGSERSRKRARGTGDHARVSSNKGAPATFRGSAACRGVAPSTASVTGASRARFNLENLC